MSSRHLALTNGARAIVHETEMQEFLLKFGFERRYGALEIVYSPRGRLVATASRLIAPAAALLPGFAKAQVRGLALQERIRRRPAPTVSIDGQRAMGFQPAVVLPP